jgi:hypothetical protein
MIRKARPNRQRHRLSKPEQANAPLRHQSFPCAKTRSRIDRPLTIRPAKRGGNASPAHPTFYQPTQTKETSNENRSFSTLVCGTG